MSAPDATLARVERVLAGWRVPVAAEIARWIPADSPAGEILYEPIRRHALRPGKGLRPALCLATCRALGGSVEAALPTAAVLELYHNAFLVHDDVEDGSLLRRDEPSLHALYGVPVAVNAGDAMLALALPPLLANTRALGVGRALGVLEGIAEMASETAEGQAIELEWTRRGVPPPGEADYVAMVARKTASYSFVAPVTLGARIAGAPGECVARLRAFGRCVGVAFQIRDDVLNLRPEGERWGKDPLDDLWEGKRTLVLSHALAAASDDERARALAVLDRPRPTPREHETLAALDGLVRDGLLHPDGRRALEATLSATLGLRRAKRPEDVAFLLGLIQRAGSLDHASAVAARFAHEAREALAACDPWLAPSEHRDFLADLVAFVSQRDH